MIPIQEIKTFFALTIILHNSYYALLAFEANCLLKKSAQKQDNQYITIFTVLTLENYI